MGVRFYDEALVKKLSSWIKDPNMTILKPDESSSFFELNIDQKKDVALSLPLIALARNKTIDILNLEKQYKTFNGFTVTGNIEKTVPVNVIPISIGYQIDIYTKSLVEADEYVRNFIFNFINYPKLEVELPYGNFKLKYYSTIHLEPAVTDNSDIREHLFRDEFCRFSLNIIVDDAYLFSVPSNPSATIESVDTDVTFLEDLVVVDDATS